MASKDQAAAAIAACLEAPNSRTDFLGKFLLCVTYPDWPEMPAFSGRKAHFSGMIYGIGPVIAKYWSATAVAARCWGSGERPSIPELRQRYTQALRDTNAGQGGNIGARSNVLIDFKAARPGGGNQAKLELQYRSPPQAQHSWQNTRVAARLHEDDATRGGFFQRLSASDYSVHRATSPQLVRGAEKERQGAGQAIQGRGRFDAGNYLDLRGYSVRRACKFLLYDTVGTDPQEKGHVHYALDGLTLPDVAGAAHRPLDQHTSKVPVCTSELRELFRMWPYFRNDVTFYAGFNVTQPPWETDSINVWAAYAAKRAQIALQAGRVQQPTDQQTAQQVIQHVRANQPQQAIQAYHTLPARCLQAKLLPHQV